MQEIIRFDDKENIYIIPNGLEKCMAFLINKSSIFLDRWQFMNFSLEKLSKNLPDDGFKYLSQEFSKDLLKLTKQKWVFPNEYMNSFEKYNEDKMPCRHDFYSSLKDECISDGNYRHSVNA